jgi:uracil permease
LVGVALALIFRVISLLRPEEVILDAEDNRES